MQIVTHLKALGVEYFTDIEHANDVCSKVCDNMNLIPAAGLEAAVMMCR